jgi:hypothetical protein
VASDSHPCLLTLVPSVLGPVLLEGALVVKGTFGQHVPFRAGPRGHLEDDGLVSLGES